MEKQRKKRARDGGRETSSQQPQNLTANWMTNCIGFVNLTTGTSDRGPWHWLAMLCPTNHNNTSSMMSQMWNNSDSLRYVWCYANSCSNLSIARHADQSVIRWDGRSHKEHIIAALLRGWKWRRQTDLLWFLFMTVSVWAGSLRGMSAGGKGVFYAFGYFSKGCGNV